MQTPPPLNPNTFGGPQQAEARGGNGLAVTSMMAYPLLVATLIIATLMLPACSRALFKKERMQCANNEKQIGLILHMFAGESEGGVYPELSPEAGQLMFSPDSEAGGDSLYLDFLIDTTILICPSGSGTSALKAQAESNPKALFDDESYVYLGYAISNQADLEAFAAAYKLRIEQGLPFNEDLPVPPGHTYSGGDKILRLRKDSARFTITDIKEQGNYPKMSNIPVFWDKASIDVPGLSIMYNHFPAGANVLYSDGHVEFIRYPGKFPITEEAIRVISELDALGRH